MTTLDQIIAETEEYVRLKAEATAGNWSAGSAGVCYHLISDTGEPAIGGGIFYQLFPYTGRQKQDSQYIAYAHNTPLEQYVMMLVNRVKRLEQAPDEARPVEHHEQCRVYGSTGVCECDYEAGNQAIDTVLNEGLKRPD